jgi:hypothetical protein
LIEWNRSKVIGLAKPSCAYCKGAGIRKTPAGKEKPCYCSFRTIFRACYNRFRECVVLAHRTSAVSLDFCRGGEYRAMYSRKGEEYMADFCLIARRTLDPWEHTIFRIHFLLGADWRLCCRQLKVERGEFFHLIYRIERRLGRVFAELEPYPLFPLDEYFGGVVHRQTHVSTRFEIEVQDEPDPLLRTAA